MVEAASNVMDFIKDEKFYRGRRGFLHPRYPKGTTSSASTSPDLDRQTKERERNRFGQLSQFYTRRARRCRNGTTSTSSSPCYPHDSQQYAHNQSSFESYDYDVNVLNGRSRTPSPGQRRNGNDYSDDLFYFHFLTDFRRNCL